MQRSCIFLLVSAVLMLLTATALAKPFGGSQTGAGVFIGEVACYGEHEIKPEFMTEFRTKFMENIQEIDEKAKIHLTGNTDWLTGGGDPTERALLTHIHMDAIAYGPNFEKAYANAKMEKYAEDVFGEQYFWDENKMAARRAGAKKPYRISQAMTDAAREIGLKYGAEYLLFCNVQEVDVELANSIFNAKTDINERAKHIKVETSAYLINAKTGMVYESHLLTEKTGRIQNLFGEYGKGMTTVTLLGAMFDMQSKKLVKDVFENGKKAL
ncbi:MAG: hypothetical protein IJ849_01650 [Selenomonadaceae bacterium]|nr:hypothetical protein [Selenomonadaceae bacterium]